MGAVANRVKADLADLRSRAPGVADSALGAMALAMALEIDRPKNSATSKSMCNRELRDTLNQLRELAPAKPEADGLDQLNAQRVKRRSRKSGAAA